MLGIRMLSNNGEDFHIFGDIYHCRRLKSFQVQGYIFTRGFDFANMNPFTFSNATVTLFAAIIILRQVQNMTTQIPPQNISNSSLDSGKTENRITWPDKADIWSLLTSIDEIRARRNILEWFKHKLPHIHCPRPPCVIWWIRFNWNPMSCSSYCMSSELIGDCEFGQPYGPLQEISTLSRDCFCIPPPA